MILKNLQNCQSVEIPRKANQAFPKAMRLWKNKEKVLLTNLLSAAWFSPSILAKPPPNPSPGSGLKRARHALTQRPSGETAGFHRGFPPSKANKLQQEVLRSKGAQSLPETKQPKPLKIGPNAPKGRSRHPSLRGEHYPSKSPWRRPETFCPNSDGMKDPSITSVKYHPKCCFAVMIWAEGRVRVSFRRAVLFGRPCTSLSGQPCNLPKKGLWRHTTPKINECPPKMDHFRKEKMVVFQSIILEKNTPFLLFFGGGWACSHPISSIIHHYPSSMWPHDSGFWLFPSRSMQVSGGQRYPCASAVSARPTFGQSCWQQGVAGGKGWQMKYLPIDYTVGRNPAPIDMENIIEYPIFRTGRCGGVNLVQKSS